MKKSLIMWELESQHSWYLCDFLAQIKFVAIASFSVISYKYLVWKLNNFNKNAIIQEFNFKNNFKLNNWNGCLFTNEQKS